MTTARNTNRSLHAAATNPYVLVVDDSLDSREMVEDYLGFCGVTVLGVSSGEAALTQAFERTPALILMDLQMPGIGAQGATVTR